MANIKLSELNATGSDLFLDSESFLNELKDVDSISGGSTSSQGYGSQGVSDISTLTKLAEAFVTVYAIGHVTELAKSFSQGY
ncbi:MULTISPECIES: hypothetical protein [unclassified Nodularia (in: cyanobacteria)]|uniref:hypothetical protein n=1 Tax=unclassified Nodularia (in: cyanobacteria) TaxID=2656917 RepID=UPI0018806FBB|nr:MULTISPECIES: hypothetical protein [unclassified Nodularia (in: cyanobacteria)]MBE9197955.1 hypothetical protein [Nodularia sp. LEGE 06071]MCC2691739.1 hypothetical protein [Nodularia sp. LEGE 04288]